MNKNNISTFRWLNTTQFLGALNDNIFKFLIILFLIGHLGEENAKQIAGKSGIFFVLPFLLFSHAGGVLADKFSKRKIIICTKIAEILIMLIGIFVFFLQSEYGLYFVLFLMASQSAFFGPSKLGIIPELVATEKISKVNSYLVMFTFLAIIIGTGISPFISLHAGKNYVNAGLVCVLIAILGTVTSFKIKKTPSQKSMAGFTPFFLAEIYRTLKYVSKDKNLFLAVMGAAYFLLIGAYVQLNIIAYGMEALKLTKEMSTYLFLITAFGIGLGSFIAGRLSGRNIEFGIVPIGSFLITATTIFLYFIKADNVILGAFVIFFMGLGAGIFIVPLESFIQWKSPSNRRGEILATSNFLSFIGVLIASSLILIFSEIFKFSAAEGFLIIGILNIFLMVLSFIYLPDFLLRFFALIVMRIFYKIEIKGINNVPVEGGALLISNHISWVDALLLVATTQRRIRFLMEREIYTNRLLYPIFKLMGLIPISFKDSPKKVIESFQNARKAIEEGFMVCIFAEGQISRSGNMSEFRKGFEKILKGLSCPIIPVYLGGVWGSIFSYYYKKPLSKMPYMIPYPVTILFGEQMPASSDSVSVKLKVMELSTEYFELKKSKRISLSQMFIKTAKENWRIKAISDSSGTSLIYGKTLISIIILGKLLKNIILNEEKVGILLPPSIGGLLSNIALTLIGKTPVNINFTASAESIKSALLQCNISTVITSKLVLKKLESFPFEGNYLYLEELLKSVSLIQKITAYFKARFFPSRFIDENKNFNADKLATIIFSSGSTAEPKGVMLSHHNISSNIESLRMILKLGKNDNLMAALPFFHSFGFTGSIWLPLLSGFSVTYHSNPLDAAKIVELIEKSKSTILVATPTFLSAYMRKAEPKSFSTLKYVIVGAEKLKPTLAKQFHEKFNIEPLEGYGTTELSPIASVNIPNINIHGVIQKGRKEGSVGIPLPGVSVKIVDPETEELQSIDTPGVLKIKGPNVMLGYLNNQKKTNEVLVNGWYNTGDIAKLDNDGFITITDRLSRFSKIAGEMVPHVAIEEIFLNALNSTEQIIAVTSIPDDKKGEQLIVLFLKEAGNNDTLYEIISKSEIPNLWKPKKENFYLINEMPILGTGKLDLKKIKSIAYDITKIQEK